ILVVLDTGRTSAGRVAGVPRLDASMDATLLLAALASRAGDRIDMMAFDRRVRARVLGAPRSTVLASFTNAMASLDAELTECDMAGLASAVLAVARRRCLIVLLTDLNVTAIQEGLLPRLPILASRNTVVVAAVADPRLDELAAGPGGPVRLYSAAAGGGRAPPPPRRRGVRVGAAPPERLPGALADAYLALKASGQL